MLARPAAIKMIKPEYLTSSNGESLKVVVSRFKKEARLTAGLRSPHTINLYDFGVTEGGVFFYVMEYLLGTDLQALVERHGPQPPERSVLLLKQAAESLSEAHRKGLIHRDVKPSNLFLTRIGNEQDFVKVLDFGLVKQQRTMADAETLMTQQGVTTGTPAFMAPEMALGKEEIDHRIDIYALGCVGYWLLTGQLVFEGSTPIEIVTEHIKTPPEPPSTRTELEIPKCLDDLIMSCLEKHPESRPANLDHFSCRLEECEFSTPWTGKRASEWWNRHLPESRN
jgi:serine/threonine-protein kinase